MPHLNRFIKKIFFGKAAYQGFFKRMHAIALEGMNIGTGGGSLDNGEAYAIRRALKGVEAPVVFDVGAQGGDYSKEVLAAAPSAKVFAFEPQKSDYEVLKKILGGRATVLNLALSDKQGDMALYYPRGAHGLSSFHRKGDFSDSETVKVQTIDAFCEEYGVKDITLLKLDVEGHELACLRGAKDMLPHIEFIQFEMSIASRDARVYFKDIFDFLSEYTIYRILKDGLVEIKEPDRLSETLFTTNYLARRKG